MARDNGQVQGSAAQLTQLVLVDGTTGGFVQDAQLDTDTALTANSDTKVATQKATKAYADALVSALQPLDSDLTAIAALTTDTYGRSLLTATSARVAQQTLGGWYVIGASGASVTGAADTNENTFATVTIPAGAMGANGILRIEYVFSMTNSANNKTMQVKLGGVGGTGFKGLVRTTTAMDRQIVTIQNRNSASSQVAWQSGSESLGVSAGTVTTGSVNTAIAQDLVITGTKASGGELLRLEQYVVELFYAA